MSDQAEHQSVADVCCKSVVAWEETSIDEGTKVEENDVAAAVEDGEKEEERKMTRFIRGRKRNQPKRLDGKEAKMLRKRASFNASH